MSLKSMSRTPLGVLLAMCLIPWLPAGCKDQKKHRAEGNAKLDEVAKLLDEVERP